jgi:O-antigen/teichoic acid export membrane protein
VAEYHYAIVLPKEETDAVGVFHVGFLLLSCLVILVGVSGVFSEPISLLFKAPSLSSVYYLLPGYVFLMGLWNLLNYWYTRQQKFGKISIYQMSQSIISSASKIILGIQNLLRVGMVYSVVFAPLISILLVVVGSWRTLTPLFKFSWNNICQQAAKYKNFPLYVMPRGLLNTLGGNLPTLLLTPYFGLVEIGFFGMALTLAFRPINIVCSSLYQVLYQKVTDKVNEQKGVLSLLRNFLMQIGVATLLLFGVLYLVMPYMVSFLLGAEWVVVSDYIRIFLPWLFFVVLNTSLSFLPDVFGKQSIYLLFEILYIVVRLLALIIGVRMDSMHMALFLFSMIGAFVLLVELCWFIYMVVRYEKRREQVGDKSE